MFSEQPRAGCAGPGWRATGATRFRGFARVARSSHGHPDLTTLRARVIPLPHGRGSDCAQSQLRPRPPHARGPLPACPPVPTSFGTHACLQGQACHPPGHRIGSMQRHRRAGCVSSQVKTVMRAGNTHPTLGACHGCLTGQSRRAGYCRPGLVLTNGPPTCRRPGVARVGISPSLPVARSVASLAWLTPATATHPDVRSRQDQMAAALLPFVALPAASLAADQGTTLLAAFRTMGNLRLRARA